MLEGKLQRRAGCSFCETKKRTRGQKYYTQREAPRAESRGTPNSNQKKKIREEKLKGSSIRVNEIRW